jgi:hypothetical protein
MNAGEINTGAYVSPSVCLVKRDQRSSTIIWWIVDLWIVLLLAATIALAVAIWCAIHGGGVVVSWHYNSWNSSVSIACSK